MLPQFTQNFDIPPKSSNDVGEEKFFHLVIRAQLNIQGVLFYFDNKDMFIDEQGRRRKSGKVKWVLIKLASTLSVAKIEYNTVKPAIHFWLLTLDYQPFIASTIGSFVAIIGYLAVADSMAYLTRLFKKP
jgi:hypothetical protein